MIWLPVLTGCLSVTVPVGAPRRYPIPSERAIAELERAQITPTLDERGALTLPHWMFCAQPRDGGVMECHPAVPIPTGSDLDRYLGEQERYADYIEALRGE